MTVGDRRFERVRAGAGHDADRPHLAAHPHRLAHRRSRRARCSPRVEHHSASRSRSTCSVGFVSRSTNFLSATARSFRRYRRVGDGSWQAGACRAPPRNRAPNSSAPVASSAARSSPSRSSPSLLANTADSGNDSTPKPRSRRAVDRPRPALTLKIGKVVVQSAGPPAEGQHVGAPRRARAHAVYVDGAILAPLEQGQVDNGLREGVRPGRPQGGGPHRPGRAHRGDDRHS